MKKIFNYIFNTREGLMILGAASLAGGFVIGKKIADNENKKIIALVDQSIKRGMEYNAQGIKPEQVKTILTYGDGIRPRISTFVEIYEPETKADEPVVHSESEIKYSTEE